MHSWNVFAVDSLDTVSAMAILGKMTSACLVHMPATHACSTKRATFAC